MKRLKRIYTFTMTLLLVSTLAQANVFEKINGLKYSLDTLKNEATLVADSSRDYSGDIVVPENITSGGKNYTVTSFGDECFFACYNLTSLTIPSSVKSLGNECFAYCFRLTSITIPSSVVSLGNNCFNNCFRLMSITIPSSVESLGNGCFYECTGFTSIVIPSSVTSVGNSCFERCSELTSITIPSSVTFIGGYCFEYCPNLKSVSCYAITPPECFEETFDLSISSMCKLYVPQESIDKYKAADGWKSFPNIYALENTRMNSTSTPSIVATCNNGIITISGLKTHENVTFYTLNGEQLGRSVAIDGTASFGVKSSGDIVITKFGGTSMKIATK